MQPILPPKDCPSCGSELVWRTDLLYCISEDCIAQVFKRLEHWGKSLKIKGLGPKTIEKLDIADLHELYSLSVDEISCQLSSEKLGEKLFAELQTSKSAPMNAVLPAFSIPLIGKSATEKLSSYMSTIFDLSYDVCRKAGLGPKATENLMNWYHADFDYLSDLPLNWSFEQREPVRLNKGTICISGRLKSYATKAEAERVLAQMGYAVKSGVTKDVSILVNESGIESAKTKQARDKGITIITNLKDFIGETNGNVA